MQENAKLELNLSEEQLHEITGGCDTCTTQEKQADHHLWHAQAHGSVADYAQVMAQTTRGVERTKWVVAAEDNSRWAGWHADQAQSLHQQIAARHPSPPPSPLPPRPRR
jgi:hypothetical protein